MGSVFAGKTLLVVEDEPGLREPLAENFESLGCRVLQAKNGQEAFALISANAVDAVISDIRMPGGDGLELLRELQQHCEHGPAAMLMTGFAEFRQEDAFQLGAEDILDKPFDLDRLEGAVGRLLTPMGERWHEAPAATPSVRIEQTYPSLEEAVASGVMGLGRGGFYVCLEQTLPAIGKMVAFTLRFASGELQVLRGEGRVRWSRPAAGEGSYCLPCQRGAAPSPCRHTCYGIEFATLSDAVRDDIVRLCELHHVRAYIPNRPDLGH